MDLGFIDGLMEVFSLENLNKDLNMDKENGKKRKILHQTLMKDNT
jgi:hypothetical protein